jgi:hypothetical protein
MMNESMAGAPTLERRAGSAARTSRGEGSIRARGGLLARACMAGLAAALSAGTAEAQREGEREEDQYVAFRAGGDVGFARLEEGNFLAVNAQALLRVWNFRFDVAAPLRFDLTGANLLRQRDWDDTRDAARIPRCMRLDLGDYDRPPDRYDPTCGAFGFDGQRFDRVYFSARVTPLTNMTLGHGTLVNSFRNSFDPDTPALGVDSEFLLWDWVQARFFLDDVTRPGVMGGRFSLWPMQILSMRDREWSWDARPDELEIGFSAVTDQRAPASVQSAFGRPVVDAQSNLRFDTQAITALSADAHYFYIFGYGDREARWKVALWGQADWVKFLGVEDMDMFNTAFRFVALNREDGWDLRIGADYRNIGNRFIPGYFDANYTVNSQQFALTQDTQRILRDAALVTPKLQYVLSRPLGRAHGFRAWASAQIPVPISRTRRSALPFYLYFEDSQQEADATLLMQVGPFEMDQLVAAAQVVRRNFNGIENLLSLDGTLIRVFGQLYLGSREGRSNNPLSNLFLSGQYDRRWNLQPDGAFAVTNDFQLNLGFAARTR